MKTIDYTGAMVTLALALVSTGAIAGPAIYRIDAARTEAAYTVTYFGVLRQDGHIVGAQGTLEVDMDAHTGRVELTLDARTARTGVSLRDAFIRDAQMLDVERHPSIGFVSTRVEFADDRVMRIDGHLTLRGVTRPVSFDVERFDCGTPGAPPPQVCAAVAHATLRRSDYGMTAWSPLIEDRVTLDFDVVATR